MKWENSFDKLFNVESKRKKDGKRGVRNNPIERKRPAPKPKLSTTTIRLKPTGVAAVIKFGNNLDIIKSVGKADAEKNKWRNYMDTESYLSLFRMMRFKVPVKLEANGVVYIFGKQPLKNYIKPNMVIFTQHVMFLPVQRLLLIFYLIYLADEWHARDEPLLIYCEPVIKKWLLKLDCVELLYLLRKVFILDTF